MSAGLSASPAYSFYSSHPVLCANKETWVWLFSYKAACLRRGGHARSESHEFLCFLLHAVLLTSAFLRGHLPSPSSFSTFVSSSIMLSLPPAAAFTLQPASVCFCFPSHSPPSAAILSLQPVFAVMHESCWPTSTF